VVIDDRSIFALQRVKELNKPVPKQILDGCKQHYETIEKCYEATKLDLEGINIYRYAGTMTHGNQELMEALLFRHYLETQTLMPAQDALSRQSVFTTADYLLGIYDMTGELMKLAITLMASTNANMVGDERVKVLSDLRELRVHLEGLNIPRTLKLGQEVSKKMEVMQTSVEKVERAFYGKTVRGAERPDGWLPDERAAATIES
jgi:predicted translin family RNA/ssDNA-binding protein